MRRALWLFGTALVVLLLSACSTPDAEAMCEDLTDECNQDIDLSDCQSDARLLERDAKRAACDSALASLPWDIPARKHCSWHHTPPHPP